MCVNSNLRDGGVRDINGESADDSGGKLITNFKNTAVYYDLVNFSDDDSRLLEIDCGREGKINFLFFV